MLLLCSVHILDADLPTGLSLIAWTLVSQCINGTSCCGFAGVGSFKVHVLLLFWSQLERWLSSNTGLQVNVLRPLHFQGQCTQFSNSLLLGRWYETAHACDLGACTCMHAVGRHHMLCCCLACGTSLTRGVPHPTFLSSTGVCVDQWWYSNEL